MSRKNVALSAFIILATVFCGIAMLGISRTPEANSAQSPVMKFGWKPGDPKEVVGAITYIMDTRPNGGLCFAYLFSGLSNGGPALANVPCSAIPSELLVKVNIPR